MDLNAPIPIEGIDQDLLLRLGLAAVLGLLLGVDREIRGYPAGLRTHGLICVASAAMTISALQLFNQLGGGQTRLDLLRVFEGAGAFVGIVAAGLIVVSGGKVHNLTTAVHVWLATIIGIACGAAQWPLVMTAALVSVIMLTLLRVVERRWIEPLQRSQGRKPDEDA